MTLLLRLGRAWVLMVGVVSLKLASGCRGLVVHRSASCWDITAYNLLLEGIHMTDLLQHRSHVRGPVA